MSGRYADVREWSRLPKVPAQPANVTETVDDAKYDILFHLKGTSSPY